MEVTARTTPHESGAPHYPEDPDVMEAHLIEGIIEIQVQLRLGRQHR